MFLDLLTLETAVEPVALMAAYRLPRPNPKNLGISFDYVVLLWAAITDKKSIISQMGE